MYVDIYQMYSHEQRAVNNTACNHKKKRKKKQLTLIVTLINSLLFQ